MLGKASIKKYLLVADMSANGGVVNLLYTTKISVFSSFEQKFIHLLSDYSLSDWLIWSHNALKNLAKEEIILWPVSFRFLGSKSPGQHSLEATTCLFEGRYWHWSQNTINLSTVITVRTRWEPPTRREKKDSHKIRKVFFLVLFVIAN